MISLFIGISDIEMSVCEICRCQILMLVQRLACNQRKERVPTYPILLRRNLPVYRLDVNDLYSPRV